MSVPKILIVEDDGQLQQMYKLKLAAQNFAVLTARTGDEAIQIAKEEHPDIILLDVMLTGTKNGFDTLEVLKRDELVKHIPVIMLTNVDTEEGVARKIGAVDYLIKVNMNLEDIVTKIRLHLPAA